MEKKKKKEPIQHDKTWVLKFSEPVPFGAIRSKEFSVDTFKVHEKTIEVFDHTELFIPINLLVSIERNPKTIK